MRFFNFWKIVFLLLLTLCLVLPYAQTAYAAPVTVAAFELNGSLGSEATVNATTNDTDLENVILSRGSGITPSALSNAFSATSFVVGGLKSNAITNNEYFEVTIQPKNGKSLSLNSINFNLRRSGTGPNAYQWQYSFDGFATSGTDIGPEGSYTGTGTNGAAMTPIDLSSTPELHAIESGTAVTFRLYAWGATGAGGTIAFGRLAGDDLSFLAEIGPSDIVAFEEAGQAGDQVNHLATTIDASLDSAVLTRGTGLNPSGLLNAFSSNSFTVGGGKTDAINNQDYIQIHILAKDGYRMSLNELNYSIRRSSQGPNTFQWQYSLDEFSTPGIDIGPEVLYTGTEDLGLIQTPVDVSGVLNLQNKKQVTLRLYAWGALSGSGTFAIGRRVGSDFLLSGVVTPRVIIGFEPSGLAGNESLMNAGTLDSHLLPVQVMRGAGVTPQLSSDAFASTDFEVGATRTNAILNNEYYQLNVQTETGYYLNFTSIFQRNLRTLSGPTTYQWQFSLDNFLTPGIDIGAPHVYSGSDLNGRSATNSTPFDIADLQNTTSVAFRMYAWGAVAPTGTFAFGKLSGDDLSFSGEVEIYKNIVTYSAADGGSISGSSTQLIDYNSSTVPVTAVPFTLNQFSHWSDGSTDNPRYDQNVTSTLNLMAYFVAQQTTITGGAGAFIPPKGVGPGIRDETLEINEKKNVGIIDQYGVNLLAKIGSQSAFTLKSNSFRQYTLSLDAVDLYAATVRFRVLDTPHIAQLKLHDQRTFDLDSDGNADVLVTFTHIYVNRIELTIKAIDQKISTDRADGAPTFIFTRELKNGSIGEDVKELQKFLNTNGFLITRQGPGSPGNETNRFGALTRLALIRYQLKNKIRATGILGPLTRESINSR